MAAAAAATHLRSIVEEGLYKFITTINTDFVLISQQSSKTARYDDCGSPNLKLTYTVQLIATVIGKGDAALSPGAISIRASTTAAGLAMCYCLLA